MKKLLSIILTGVVALSLAGCEKKVDTDESGVSSNGSDDAAAVEQVKLYYGTDKQFITLYRPENSEFQIDPDEADDDDNYLVEICENDLAWVMDVWGDVAYSYGNGDAIAYYYYNGELSEDTQELYTSFEQDVRDLGIEFMGKPVKRIESRSVDEGDDEEDVDIFIGIEFEDTRDGEHCGDGLLGYELSMYDEVPSDEKYIELFKQVFGMDK